MINWKNIKRFSIAEFPEDPDKFAEPQLIYKLNTFALQLGKAIYPSPVKGALARLSGSKTSQHYAINRKSTAVDIFCEGVPFFVLSELLVSKLFRGIGIYLDTDGVDGLPWVMFHVDLRPKKGSPLIWIARKEYDAIKEKIVTKYYYPQNDSDHWKLLQNDHMYVDRHHR